MGRKTRGGKSMSLLVSYNLACKMNNPKFYEQADIIRLNSPWYTPVELENILRYETKPKFLDVNIKERKKPKIFSHKFEDLLTLAGKYSIDWIGISNVEDSLLLPRIKELIDDTRTKICAKIETKKGYDNCVQIIKSFDAIMVDVEDLASEVGWKDAKEMQSSIHEICMAERKDYFILSGVIFELKKQQKKICYTYGAFDLLHQGHINMLHKAKSFGDYLIVGVVSDHAIQELKGPDRPIENQIDRFNKLCELKIIDKVVHQKEYDPTPNLELYRPDVLVKGDDWKIIPGENWIRDHGGVLIKPHYSEGWSTSGLVKKIRGEK
jgi:D-glycero-beta-D-manno-heptose 1-phosphate adenylyltransferase